MPQVYHDVQSPLPLSEVLSLGQERLIEYERSVTYFAGLSEEARAALRPALEALCRKYPTSDFNNYGLDPATADLAILIQSPESHQGTRVYDIIFGPGRYRLKLSGGDIFECDVAEGEICLTLNTLQPFFGILATAKFTRTPGGALEVSRFEIHEEA